VPTYDYQCRSCGFIAEVVHSMLEDGPSQCERCGGQLRRVIHPSGIIFKGGGFYKTDSRSSSSGGASRGAAGSGEAGGPAPSSKATATSDSGSAPPSSGGDAARSKGGGD
jgi:putative FmdB family regulatory protein